MQFLSTFVILAVAACASASILPLGQSLSVSHPILSAHRWSEPAVAWATPGVWAAPTAAWATPAAWAAPVWAPAHIAAATPEGKYVAANRGSVHVAPLPGHLQSASSLNLQPAPGTW